MVGVANPLNNQDRRAASRFIGGLWFGSLVGSLLVAALLSVAAVTTALIPEWVRSVAAAAIIVTFALFDLVDRTPQISRQVPQRFARVLSDGLRGLWWGADLSLVYTTRKATSLLWVTLAAGVLVTGPAIAVLSLLAANIVFLVGVTIRVKTGRLAVLEPMFDKINISPTVRNVRRFSGALLLVVAGVLAVVSVAQL